MAKDKGPVTLALDQVANAVLVSDLRNSGFRKRGRNWWRETASAVSGIVLFSHPSNGITSPAGSFTIEFGFSYPRLGEPYPGPNPKAWSCRHRFRIGQVMPDRRDRWWKFQDTNDPGEVEAVIADFRPAWHDYGLPFLLAGDDPRSVRDRLVSDGPGFPLAEAARLSLALDDKDDAERIIVTFLTQLFSDKSLASDDSDYVRFVSTAVPVLQALDLHLDSDLDGSCRWAYGVAAARLRAQPDAFWGFDADWVLAVGEYLNVDTTEIRSIAATRRDR